MEFSPNNPIVKLSMQGADLERKGEYEKANKLFLQAWNEATEDFEKLITAYYLAQHSQNGADKLKWYETALLIALKTDDNAVKSALSSLYASIAQCYEDLGNPNHAQKNNELSVAFKDQIFDKGPFYHGTRADLQIGDMLTAGYNSNYNSEIVMNHVYFTALVNGAGLAAALAKGDGCERVYIVEPMGDFENDPNVTDKKFPGNLTRSYRMQTSLKIIGEVKDWARLSPEELQKWRKRLANVKGEIIN